MLQHVASEALASRQVATPEGALQMTGSLFTIHEGYYKGYGMLLYIHTVRHCKGLQVLRGLG